VVFQILCALLLKLGRLYEEFGILGKEVGLLGLQLVIKVLKLRVVEFLPGRFIRAIVGRKINRYLLSLFLFDLLA